MRVFRCVLACVGLAVFGASLSGADVRGRALEILRTHAQDGHRVISEYNALPLEFSSPSGTTIRFSRSTDFMQYIKGSSESGILGSLSTAVHEICHGLTARKGAQMRLSSGAAASGGGAYLLNGRYLFVPYNGQIFPSHKVKSMIPKRLRTTRFETYVEDDDEAMGTQQEGIYGQLDEWHAYYHDMLASVDLWSYYRAKSRLTADECADFFAGIDGTLYAYGEFKLYLLACLRYARERVPQAYQAYLGNTAFRTVVLELDQAFSSLIARYFAMKPTVIAHMRAQGHDVRDEGDTIWIGETGRGTFRKEWKLLETALSSQPWVREFAAVRSGVWR